MSLINKMLQDLDAREQKGGLGTSLPVDVRPLPSQRSSRLPYAIGIVLTALLLAGLAYTYWWVPAEEAKPVTVPLAGAVVQPSPPEAAPVFSYPVGETKNEEQAALVTELQTQMPEQMQTPSPLPAATAATATPEAATLAAKAVTPAKLWMPQPSAQAPLPSGAAMAATPELPDPWECRWQATKAVTPP